MTESKNERRLRAENKLLKNQVKNQESIKTNNSITSSRLNNFGFLMSSHKGNRDYFKQFGYPDQINFDNYLVIISVIALVAESLKRTQIIAGKVNLK